MLQVIGSLNKANYYPEKQKIQRKSAMENKRRKGARKKGVQLNAPTIPRIPNQ
jgi:hypothetical protein